MGGTRGEDAAGLCMLPAGSVTAPALRGLSRFADSRGIPAGREFLLDYDVIEAFCVAGLAGRAPATRGTYRSALYRLAGAGHGPPGQRAAPFPGARAPAPYSPGQRAELAAIAAAQRDPVKRSSALALVVFGIGAGLRPGRAESVRFFVRGGFLLPATGCLSGVFLSRYLKFICPVYVPLFRNRAYPSLPGQVPRVRISRAIPGACCLILLGSRGGCSPCHLT